MGGAPNVGTGEQSVDKSGLAALGVTRSIPEQPWPEGKGLVRKPTP